MPRQHGGARGQRGGHHGAGFAEPRYGDRILAEMARRVLVERCRHQNMTAPAAVRGEYEEGWR